MKNKSFLMVSIILALLFISTISFANNDMGNDIKNGIHSITDTAVDGTANLANDVRSGIQNAENAVENGVKNIGNAISDGAQNMENEMSDDNMNNVGSAITDDNNGYTTTRTSTADAGATGVMDSSVWTWVILAIAGVVIIGLVWYYAAQHNDREH